MLKRFIKIIGGDPNRREIDRNSTLVDQINALEPEFENFSDEALRAKTDEFRRHITERIAGITDEKDILSVEQDALDEILIPAFAVVREASKRTIGLRHFDVQLIGGMALHQGKIAEMRTGEGKTLVATLPLYLNALTGRGVHLVTVNDYLARRDARWMAPIYNLLGLNVGVLQMASRTENGKKAFLIDQERESPHEDQNQLRMVMRGEAYAADITYGTNSEFGFDYLRDNMTMSLEERVQRGHFYAIIDEVDNVLIDEARTPLIISGPAQDEAEWYIRMAQVVRQLEPQDYEVSEKDRNITLSEIGEAHVETLIGVPLRDPERPEDITIEQARMLGYLEQALRAQFLFRKNKDYLVQAGKVIIIDEFTGRLMPGRRWSDGLHQAVEAKEGVKVENESVTYATVTIQNYFRMYHKLAGMSGTAVTESEEFDKIYNLGVLAIPTNLEYQADRPESGLEETETKDEQGYKFRYYARRDDLQKDPVYYKRKDYPDVIFRTEEAKLRVIAREILRDHVLGRPVLVGTTSVEMSERVSARLKAEPLRRLALTLLLRNTWMQQNNREEDGRQIDELQFLYETLEKIDIAEMRRLGRDLGLSFNAEEAANLEHLLAILEVGPEYHERLAKDLAGGIPHEVLNARKHTEESQIIAGAGAFGAVTIATNMAGRGVDIKLGGELAEEIISAVNRILGRNGYSNPYEMTLQERRQALRSLSDADFGIYGTEMKYFLQHMDEMEQVHRLGGLHVIGSERHEARRIDNQLRGRSARQGDPGASRFYLSMQDELMRLFGGVQAENMMERLKVDDLLPLEYGVVSRIVEQAQTRVEGANFDMRKHLLDYDDVLNAQRSNIYAQRDRIFIKEDLTEDVAEMLRTELKSRVLEALKDEGGPWKLLAWLDQVQPPQNIGGVIYPSFTQRLIIETLPQNPNRNAARRSLLDLAFKALQAEKEHHLQTINDILHQNEQHLKEQVDERLDALDIFIDGIKDADETDTRRPAELAAELSDVLRLPLRLSPDLQRMLRDDPDKAHDALRDGVRSVLNGQAILRLVGSIERRLEEPLGINTEHMASADWDALSQTVLDAVNEIFNRRVERNIGDPDSPGGQIGSDLDNVFGRLPDPLDNQALLQLVLLLPQGARSSFDKRTHRRITQRTTRLAYSYYAAHLLENRNSNDVVENILEHLEEIQEVLQQDWGRAEMLRLGNATLGDLEEGARQAIFTELGTPSEIALHTLLNEQPEEDRQVIAEILGRRALTNIYRQLLLNVITQLWVDYLTQMEALRVSIGLEAYAQRDPLVQYKSRASELFQNLLSSMRLEIITRMFTFRVRDLSSVQTSATRSEDTSQVVESPQEKEEGDAGNVVKQGSGKRRRRRR
jgi:preprotein translocase subunit SecA